MIRNLTLIGLAVVHLGPGSALAQERKLFYSRTTGNLSEATAMVRNFTGKKLDYSELTRTTDCFVRVVSKGKVLTPDGKPIEDAVIGGKPFVFLTNPQSLLGRSLLDLYEDIGYEAEDIIRWQHNVDMVALVFRYPKDISTSPVLDGRLPKNWDKAVYVPTWNNAFALFERLAETAEVSRDRKEDAFAPKATFFKTDKEKAFVLNFPDEGKERLRRAKYAEIKALGGSDWAYRRLLEAKLSVFEHFRGNGRTHNEVNDPEGDKEEAGLFEFVGPNMKLSALPDLAIVDLGSLSVREAYSIINGSLDPKAK